jgi:predicted MFS family arabinose efflux permease
VALLAAARTPLVLAALLVLVGLGNGPMTVVASTLLDAVAPPGTGTEAFTLMVMGFVAGTAAGTAAGGALVDATSYSTAVLIAGAVPLLGSLAAIARRRTISG